MIRRADARDIDSVERIYNKIHSCEEAGKIKVGWIRGVYPTRKTAEDALLRGDLFVYEADGEIAASAIINQIQVPEYSDCMWKYGADDREVMVLHTLTVDPDKSGRGTGKEFVKFYEEYAKDSGCRFLRMDTNADNAVARAMYSKLGYSEAGIVDCCFNGIPGVKLVCLEKKLKNEHS